MQRATVRNIRHRLPDWPVRGPDAEKEGGSQTTQTGHVNDMSRRKYWQYSNQQSLRGATEAAAHHERANVHAAAHLRSVVAQSSPVSPTRLADLLFLFRSSGRRSDSATQTVQLLVAARPKYNKTERKLHHVQCQTWFYQEKHLHTTEQSPLENFLEQLNVTLAKKKKTASYSNLCFSILSINNNLDLGQSSTLRFRIANTTRGPKDF